MANYESTDELSGAISSAVASGQLSPETSDIISGLIAGMTTEQLAEVVQSEDLSATTLPKNTPVVMMSGTAKFDAQIPADSPITFVQAAPGVGSNNITFLTDQAVAVALGGGANDKVTTAGGNDAITFVGASTASAVINTGAGEDNVLLRAAGTDNNGGTVELATGEGGDIVNWGSASSRARAAGDGEGEAWNGTGTIDMGEGDDVLYLNNSASGTANVLMGADNDRVYVGTQTSSWTGTATIDTGAGDDEVNLINGGGTANLLTGEGRDTVNWSGWNGTATINTGDGRDVVSLTDGGGTADISTGAEIDRVTWNGWKGNATIDTGDAADTVSLSSGSGTANVTTGLGEDSVYLGIDWNGQTTIDTGDGNDQVTLGNSYQTWDAELGRNVTVTTTTEAVINLGAGNDALSAGNWLGGKATVDGGTGFDQVDARGQRDQHSFRYVNGSVVMDGDDGNGITMQNVNVVAFGNEFYDDRVQNTPRDITVFATSAGDALIARLYQVALGREAIDNAYGTNGLHGTGEVSGWAGGLSYWTEVYNNGDNSTNLLQTAYDFLGAGEFQRLYGGMDDQTFIIQLFHNLDKADGQWNALTEINGKTVQDFVNQLDGTQEARWNAAIEIANSTEAVQLLGQDGNQYIIADTGTNITPDSE